MPTLKSTFSLDQASIQKLKRLARKWQVSKTEVLRRALAKAEEPDVSSVEERLEALHRLQRWAKEKQIDFQKWKKTIKNGRR